MQSRRTRKILVGHSGLQGGMKRLPLELGNIARPAIQEKQFAEFIVERNSMTRKQLLLCPGHLGVENQEGSHNP
jgi:hypothetical protein